MHYIIDDTLSYAMPDLPQSLLHELDECRNVSVHASVPKEDILAFSVTQEYTKY